MSGKAQVLAQVLHVSAHHELENGIIIIIIIIIVIIVFIIIITTIIIISTCSKLPAGYV